MPKIAKGKHKRKKARADRIAGGRLVRKQTVEGGYENGFDKVHVVIDTISAMRARGQLSQAQHMAAEKYRIAWGANASLGSCLDDSKTGGSAFGPRGKAVHLIEATETLRHAREILGQRDGEVVRLIVGEDLTIKEATVVLCKAFGAAPTQRHVDGIGMRLRDSLDTLALAWFGNIKGGKRRMRPSAMTEDARPTVVRPGRREIEPQAVSSAYDSSGVFKVRKAGANG